ncbi:hypothetical protein CCACVL1_28427 [Corchorus capsularis]|uniref:Uncharacterized protein n=1 Tax=Corchorus capsularis TaxID=210143 RepID=A0A1R3G6J6_COCAP|nr:hypothetical protein CCACVL1_28427 [Corchorus capsularis]
MAVRMRAGLGPKDRVIFLPIRKKP